MQARNSMLQKLKMRVFQREHAHVVNRWVDLEAGPEENAGHAMLVDGAQEGGREPTKNDLANNRQ